MGLENRRSPSPVIPSYDMPCDDSDEEEQQDDALLVKIKIHKEQSKTREEHMEKSYPNKKLLPDRGQ